MGKADFSDEYKQDAAAQMTERGYPVAEVSKRLGGQPAFALCLGEEVQNSIRIASLNTVRIRARFSSEAASQQRKDLPNMFDATQCV